MPRTKQTSRKSTGGTAPQVPNEVIQRQKAQKALPVAAESASTLVQMHDDVSASKIQALYGTHLQVSIALFASMAD